MQQPDDDASAPALREWLRRVRLGTVVLFWTYLLSLLLPNLYGFALPFLTLTGGRELLRWTWLIQIVAGVASLIGVWAITGPLPVGAAVVISSPLRRVLRLLAGMGMLGGIVRGAARIHGSWTDLPYLPIPVFVVQLAAILFGLAYLRHLAQRLSLSQLARSFGFFACVYLCFRAAGLIGSALELRQVWPLGWTLWVIASGGLVWLWGLILLRRFASRLALALEGRCMHCGYQLRGLPENRCPECGTPFFVPSLP